MTAARTTHTLPDYLNGRIIVAGAGVSGLGSLALLRALERDITVSDDNPAARSAVEAAGARCLSTAEVCEDIDEYSCVVTSPGWRPDTPLLIAAASAGIPVIGDVELAYLVDRAEVFGPRRTWLAITGTNGKTTTTAMLEAMMRGHNPASMAVGNIGLSIHDALLATPRVDVLVAELSSFQLHWINEFTPDCGCVLNLAEDHLDWHGSLEAYGADKAKILRGPLSVLGSDDEAVAEMSSLAAGEVVGFTLAEPQVGQVGIRDGWIVDRAFPLGEGDCPEIGEGVRIRSVDGLSPAGRAGQLDALAATAMARAQGVDPDVISAALDGFTVAAHRGQVVHRARRGGGVITVVDNSKATNPHAADAALKGIDHLVWVAGGQLKGADVAELIAAHGSRMSAAALLGVDAPLIAAELARQYPQLPVHVTASTDRAEAMADLAEFVAEVVQPGDTVMLAPAAASLDMYSGMGERGDIFAAAMRAALPDTDLGG